MKLNIKTFLIIGLTSLLTIACDTGLGLMTTKITGAIIFVNSDKKPDWVESVQVIAASQSLFDEPSLDDVVLADRPVNLSKERSSYEIFVPKGTYVALAAIFKKKGEDWNYLHILGLYGFDPVTYKYYDKNPIVISDKNQVASGYDIICDWTFISPGKS